MSEPVTEVSAKNGAEANGLCASPLAERGSVSSIAGYEAGLEMVEVEIGVDGQNGANEGLAGEYQHVSHHHVSHRDVSYRHVSYQHVSHHHGLLESIQSLLTIVTVAVFVITFIVQPFRIPSGSMEQTLLVGDFLLVDKQTFAVPGKWWSHLLPYEPIRRGDIIVFHYPVEPSIHLVKRVVGLPGDTLHLERGLVFVNGVQLHEPYAIYQPTHPDAFRDSFPAMREGDAGIEPQWWIEMRHYVHGGELTVPAGRYFVMGDNRNDSQDSRYWGFVPRETIVGQPWIIYFSLRHPGGDEQSVLPAAAEPQHGGPLGFVANALGDLARWDRSFRVVR